MTIPRMRRSLLAIPLVAALLTTFTPVAANAAVGTEQFSLSASSGRAGMTGKFTQGDPCPTFTEEPGAWSVVEFTFTDAAGTVFNVRDSVGANPDGTWQGRANFTIPYRSLGTTDSPPKFPSEAALGMGSFTARCILHPGGNVVQEYAPQPFNVTGASQTFSVAPTTVQPSANVTISSVDPCPSDQVEVEIRDATHARITEPRVVPDANGAWSVTMPASQLQWDGSPDIPFEPGAGVVRAYCMVTEADTSASVVFAYADQSLTIGSTTPPPAPSCKDTLFIGVAGSGQKYKTDADLTISREVKRVYDSFRAAFPAPRTVGVQMLNYPAPPVSMLTEKNNGNWIHDSAQFFYSNLPRYMEGKNAGVEELHRQVGLSRSNCPNQRIVLAGYSQGAMVIHDFLLEYNATASTANKRAIKAVVLIADPMRFANTRANRLGTAARGTEGVCEFVNGPCNRTQPHADIPSYYAPRTYSVCEQYDTVCDLSAAVNMFWSLGPDGIRLVGDTVHGLYPITNATKTAGQRAAQTVVNLP